MCVVISVAHLAQYRMCRMCRTTTKCHWAVEEKGVHKLTWHWLTMTLLLVDYERYAAYPSCFKHMSILWRHLIYRENIKDTEKHATYVLNCSLVTQYGNIIFTSTGLSACNWDNQDWNSHHFCCVQACLVLSSWFIRTAKWIFALTTHFNIVMWVAAM